MKNVFVILLCFRICSATLFAAFTSEEARQVFGESSSDESSISQIVGEYLFLKIEWQEDPSDSTEEREAQELSTAQTAIEEFILANLRQSTNSPFCGALTSWMKPDFNFQFSDVPCSIVKNETEKNGTRRQVLALDAEPILKLRELATKESEAANDRSPAAWLELLKKASGNFKTSSEKKKFNVLLGCPIVNYIVYNESKSWGEGQKECEAGLSEMKRILTWTPDSASFFSEYPNLLWSAYSSAHETKFYPFWKEKDDGQFLDAEKKYREGRDIPQIMNLLAESIAMNPISSKKWEYLGGVLKASDKPQDALIAYIQALKFDHDNEWAWNGFLSCCKKLGLNATASGLEWYLQLRGMLGRK
jgi:tetratricopeptide (TPR) repeat protein